MHWNVTLALAAAYLKERIYVWVVRSPLAVYADRKSLSWLIPTRAWTRTVITCA